MAADVLKADALIDVFSEVVHGLVNQSLRALSARLVWRGLCLVIPAMPPVLFGVLLSDSAVEQGCEVEQDHLLRCASAPVRGSLRCSVAVAAHPFEQSGEQAGISAQPDG